MSFLGSNPLIKILWVGIAAQKGSGGATPIWNAVPFKLDLKPGMPGFKIGAQEVKQKDTGFSLVTVSFDIEWARSSEANPDFRLTPNRETVHIVVTYSDGSIAALMCSYGKVRILSAGRTPKRAGHG